MIWLEEVGFDARCSSDRASLEATFATYLAFESTSTGCIRQQRTSDDGFPLRDASSGLPVCTDIDHRARRWACKFSHASMAQPTRLRQTAPADWPPRGRQMRAKIWQRERAQAAQGKPTQGLVQQAQPHGRAPQAQQMQRHVRVRAVRSQVAGTRMARTRVAAHAQEVHVA